jgi:hypothetical protein
MPGSGLELPTKQQIYVPGPTNQVVEHGPPETAIAAGASQGQAQALGMQGKGGGGNAQAQQHIANSQEVEGAETGATATTGAAVAKPALQHYTVEICAWIPHARVVDPEEPARASDWLDTVSDLMPTLIASPNYEFESHYRGDDHVGYDVSKVRVWARIDFDWDGSALSGVKVTGDTGASHRDWSRHLEIQTLGGFGPSVVVAKDSGTETAKAAAGESGSGSGAKFNIAFSSANPLVMTWAPDINSNLSGTIDSKGGLDIKFSTDFFPSHGIQVSRDGAVVHQETVRDASGVPGEGASGAAAIGAFLSAQLNDGDVKVKP